MNDFEAFYRSHIRLVFAMALAQGATSDHAQDLAQETFYRALRHFDRISSLEPLAQRAWLVRTLNHLMIDGWRRTRLSTLAEQPAPSKPVEPGERIALRLDISRALQSLEATDRAVVVLRYMMEMNSREIGEILEMPEATVRSRLQRCRAQLSQRLAAWHPKAGQE